jgi:MFS transporter, DHA1 family, inner membrane transport protein
MTAALRERARPRELRAIRLARGAALSCLALLVVGAFPVGADRFGDATGVPAWADTVAAAAGAGVALASTHRSTYRRPVTVAAGLLAALALLWVSTGLLVQVFGVPLILLAGQQPPYPLLPAAVRGLAAVSAALLVASILSGRRSATPGPRASWLGIVSLVLVLAYPALKTAWALGFDIGVTGKPVAHGFDAGWLPVLFALAGAVLIVALTVPPRWVDAAQRRAGLGRLPVRGLLLTGGWFGSVALLTALPIVLAPGSGDTGDLAGWVFTLVYGSWALLGPMLAGTTWVYQQRTRERHDD